VEVSYFVPEPGTVTLDVLDARGRHLRTLREGHHEPGWASAGWDVAPDEPRSVASGVYFLRVRGITGGLERKIVILD
jgi:hypothetical protein